jgi:hypothetical protein
MDMSGGTIVAKKEFLSKIRRNEKIYGFLKDSPFCRDNRGMKIKPKPQKNGNYE